MIYQELINNIRDLGFSDDAEVQDFGELVPNSINRAITEINLEVAPNIERYEFDISGTDEGYMYITMPDIDDNFLDFADTPVMYAESSAEKKDGKWVSKEKPLYKAFNDYQIEAGDTIVINADSFHGEVPDKDEKPEEYEKASKTYYSIRICYKAAHTPYDGSQLTEDIPLPKKVHHLVPLLASYYVWLEDEPVKAAQYYNLYEQKKAELSTANAKPRMTVVEGGI